MKVCREVYLFHEDEELEIKGAVLKLEGVALRAKNRVKSEGQRFVSDVEIERIVLVVLLYEAVSGKQKEIVAPSILDEYLLIFCNSASAYQVVKPIQKLLL